MNVSPMFCPSDSGFTLQRRGLLAAGAMALSGCANLPFQRLSRNLKELEELTALHGTVTAAGATPAGPLTVMALTQEGASWRVANHGRVSDGRFTLRVEGGLRYRVVVCSAEVLAGGGMAAISEPQTPAPGPTKQPIALTLTSATARGLPAAWLQALRDLDSVAARPLPVAMGQQASLADPMFDDSVAQLGMWAPADFLGSVGGGIYMLQPWRPDRLPVVLVHGAAGSPRDLEAVAAALDRTKVQPWVFHYPSGLRLNSAATMLQGILGDIAQRLPLQRVGLVAHSMGGLVAMATVHRLAAAPSVLRVPLLATISSPWGGHGAAAWGVRLAPATVPSWLDMQVGSPFQQQLQRQPLPKGTLHHMHFTYKGSGDDGTVSLASQLVFPIQARAARLRGHDEDHTSILASSQLTAEIRSATASVA